MDDMDRKGIPASPVSLSPRRMIAEPRAESYHTLHRRFPAPIPCRNDSLPRGGDEPVFYGRILSKRPTPPGETPGALEPLPPISPREEYLEVSGAISGRGDDPSSS